VNKTNNLASPTVTFTDAEQALASTEAQMIAVVGAKTPYSMDAEELAARGRHKADIKRHAATVKQATAAFAKLEAKHETELTDQETHGEVDEERASTIYSLVRPMIPAYVNWVFQPDLKHRPHCFNLFTGHVRSRSCCPSPARPSPTLR